MPTNTTRPKLSATLFVLLLIVLTPVAFAFPGFSGVQPLSGSSVNSTAVQFTINEDLDYGFITWQRTGGAADGVVHLQTLEGAELLTGTFTGIITNYPVLNDGAVYSVSFAGGNANGDATTIVRTSVLYDVSPPVIVSVTIPDGTYTVGDTITITITADGTGYLPGAITVNGQPTTSFLTAGTTYTADYTVGAGDPARAAGTIPVSVVLVDAAGNPIVMSFVLQDIDNAYNIVRSPSGFLNCGDGTPDKPLTLQGPGGTVAGTCTYSAPGTYQVQLGVTQYGPDLHLSDGSVNPAATQYRSAITRTHVAQ